MKTLVLLLLHAFASCLGSHASHWGNAPIHEITMKARDTEVSVKSDPKTFKLISIEVKFGEEKVVVPAAELVDIDSVNLLSLRLITSFGQGNLESMSLLENTLIVTLDFGKECNHFDWDRDKIIAVSPRVRFIFKDTKYERRETVIPIENFENEWHFFTKDPGAKKSDAWIDEKAKNPYPGAK
ncbi:hypothetical protein V2O64_17960 [Verrucomicrobiaceae bacterium 227]